jgi:hypothetical protein
MGKVANMKQLVAELVSWDFQDASQGAFASNNLNIPNGISGISLTNTSASTVTTLNSAGVPLGRVLMIHNSSANTVTFTDTAFGSLSANGQLVLTGAANAGIQQGGTLTLKLESNGTFWYWTEIARNTAA